MNLTIRKKTNIGFHRGGEFGTRHLKWRFRVLRILLFQSNCLTSRPSKFQPDSSFNRYHLPELSTTVSVAHNPLLKGSC
ncbi:hypothetical protein PanWU01x14_147090 [Parasponia andersonii]|uniref:Uncharacterized protein n=1 Tax=Parasponia andersonii TaxID=3476 RepID=A0A2P5CJX5_PARAD|nr:hypothetical protein PanWU01x14_147090 [Parasponia andersonii]